MEEPTMRTAFRTTLPTLGVLLLFVCLADCLAGQISASFGVPIVGYVLDADVHGIRPITGIPGNSRIDTPINLNFPVANAAFLPDERHALVDSPEFPETLVVDLAERSHSAISGAPSSSSAIRTSSDGTKAALHYPSSHHLLVVGGLPSAPAVQSTIDLSSQPPLTRFAVSNDGATALLAFRGDESDELFRWTRSGGLTLVATASRISDVVFADGDAVFADSRSNEVVLLRNVREQVSLTVIANSSDEILQPAALSVSSRSEIYVGTPDSVFVMDRFNHSFRKLSCDCTVSMLGRLHDSTFRLTDDLYRPIFILDGRTTPERILFVPALSVETKEIVP
jgi:hypothetical protein